ncbi:MAG: hypothetical protein SF339_09430 [Blastocatellia bacterium]|nr:hypothetical protein [Blastocatellia bacterium]
MAKKVSSELSDEQLRAKLKAAKAVQLTIAIIFGIIILAWIVGGYWQKNVPVFISTLAMAISITTLVSLVPRKLANELKQRRQS